MQQSGLQTVQTSDAPAAVGPYSQAVRAGSLLFLSGQIPLDPATNQMVTGGIEVEAQRVLDNLKAVLASQGLGFENVVRTTVYLTDMADFARLNEVYARNVGSARPARACIQVAALPKGARVEIDAVAAYPGS